MFGGKIFSAFTGVLFLIMVARRLIPAQFGLYEVIADLVVFSSYPVGMVAYWATRDIARGRMVGKTALVVSGLMSGAGILLYFILTSLTYTRIAAPLLPFLLGSLLVPLSYWNQVALSIVNGYRPIVNGYALVVSEIVKVSVAYEALYVYGLGIQGVIIALMASYFVQSLVCTYLARGATTEQLQLSEAKRWGKLAWLPAINYMPLTVGVGDTYIASLGFGTAITGIYQAAFTVATVIGYSSALANSLYPLLLRGGDKRLPAVLIEFSLLFSVPMAVGVMALASPFLFMLGPMYLPGIIGLSILSVESVFGSLSYIVDMTLLGTEKVDQRREESFRSLVRSNLLYVPLINFSMNASYLVGLYLALSYASASGLSSSVAIALWASVQLCTTTFFVFVKSRRARRSARLMPGVSVVYYLVSAATMGILVHLLSGMVLDRSAGTLVYGLQLSAVIGAGAAIYFGLVYALDPKFRAMVLQHVLRRFL